MPRTATTPDATMTRCWWADVRTLARCHHNDDARDTREQEGGEMMKTSNKRVLVCNTGRCNGRKKVTPVLRPKVRISEGDVHSLSCNDAGRCPVCGSDAGFVDRDAARFSRSISDLLGQAFEF